MPLNSPQRIWQCVGMALPSHGIDQKHSYFNLLPNHLQFKSDRRFILFESTLRNSDVNTDQHQARDKGNYQNHTLNQHFSSLFLLPLIDRHRSMIPLKGRDLGH
jgi:hypothetical protein